METAEEAYHSCVQSYKIHFNYDENDMKVHKESTGLLVSMATLFTGICLSLFYFLGTSFVSYLVMIIAIFLYLLTINFFRCPKRHSPFANDDRAVVAPADGKIVAIEEVSENEILHERCIQVSIFMSVFNVHANWFPCKGKVTHVSHKNGHFIAAYLPKSSTDNERSAIVIKTERGARILARQIAGALARRIVTYAEVGDICSVDAHMGFIKFGSRVDVYLPLGSQVEVKMDQKTVGNQTLIARLPE